MNTSELQNFQMPAEWEPHQGTWLTFPHDEAHWPGYFENIPSIWGRMVAELSLGEEVHIGINDEATEKIALKVIKEAGADMSKVHLHPVPNNFSWARDHGPIFLKNDSGERKIVHFGFNAWGEKYKHDLDEKVPEYVAEITHTPLTKAPMILEGGSIDVNGQGTLLTTESCLLNPNRNPQLGKQEIEENLKKYLGVSHIIWLGGEVSGDDTNGHVDDMTRFVSANKIVTVVEENPDDENYQTLKDNYEILKKSLDQDGKPFEVIVLPMPDPVILEGQRLPASYANFYIGNKVVLLPAYNCSQDQVVKEIFESLFPGRKIAAIDCRELIWGLGAFHCVTQQIPTGD